MHSRSVASLSCRRGAASGRRGSSPCAARSGAAATTRCRSDPILAMTWPRSTVSPRFTLSRHYGHRPRRSRSGGGSGRDCRSPSLIARIGDHAGFGRLDGRAFGHRDIDALVAATLPPKPAMTRPLGGPAEFGQRKTWPMRRCSPSSLRSRCSRCLSRLPWPARQATTLAVFTAVSAAFAASVPFFVTGTAAAATAAVAAVLASALTRLDLAAASFAGLDLRDLRSRLGDSSSLGGCSRRGLSTLHELHAALANGGACGFGRGGGDLGGRTRDSGPHRSGGRVRGIRRIVDRDHELRAGRRLCRGGKAIRSADGLLGHPIAVREGLDGLALPYADIRAALRSPALGRAERRRDSRNS